MKFEWDDAKAAANIRKHGVEFSSAVEAFDDPLCLDIFDAIYNGEERWIIIGRTVMQLLMVVYTERGENGEIIRIISARKANKHEQSAYDKVRFRSR